MARWSLCPKPTHNKIKIHPVCFSYTADNSDNSLTKSVFTHKEQTEWTIINTIIFFSNKCKNKTQKIRSYNVQLKPNITQRHHKQQNNSFCLDCKLTIKYISIFFLLYFHNITLINKIATFNRMSIYHWNKVCVCVFVCLCVCV